jgi:hypothetical protein
MDYLQGIVLSNGDVIDQLTDTNPTTNVNRLAQWAAGDPIPTAQIGFGAAPEVTFTTPQVKTILDACGLYGLDMSAGNADLYYRKAVAYGTRETLAAEAHVRLRAVQALLLWDTITCRKGGLAEISCRIIPTYDGSTAPLVPLSSQAIPTCGAATEFFGMGPIELNTTNLSELEEWTFNLNPEAQVKVFAGEDYPSHVHVARHAPELNITTSDLDYWETIGVGGLNLTSVEAWLRKRQANSVQSVADGTAEHIKITGALGLATTGGSSGGADSDPATMTINAALRAADCSAANAATISTASAIA